jgi:DNA repair protein SbcD/Mre11
MPTVLHFADAHIDIAGHGRHDPLTGLPLRVLDFLKALDQIVDTAINEKVDLVLFAGDAYKDRTPSPTYQREWGRRIIRLSQAGIPTLLLIGNHDLSPAAWRANALQEFDTLQIPHIHVLSKPSFLGPSDLEGLPLQVMAFPWIPRSGLMSALGLSATEPDKIDSEINQRLEDLKNAWFVAADPTLPTILTAHALIQGASLGSEQRVTLGGEWVLSPGFVRDSRLDYVALGHIHKAQNINEGQHPPIVYPGSIEKVDFGEIKDKKSFVIAHVTRGKTTIQRKFLIGRRFIDRYISIESNENINEQIIDALKSPEDLENAIVRLIIEYPRELGPYIDEPAIRQYAQNAFEFHLVRRPLFQNRARLPQNVGIGSLSSLELLDKYLDLVKTPPKELDALHKLAEEIIEK